MPNPPKSARRIVINGQLWRWTLSGLDRIVLWSPDGKKSVVDHFPVTGRRGEDIGRAQWKKCGPEVGALTPKDVRETIKFLLASSQSQPIHE